MPELSNSNRSRTVIRMGLVLLVGVILAFLVIFPLRGIMNAVSRIDYVSQRLDDYPRMKQVYLQDWREMTEWWQKESYDQRALQAAVIYDRDDKHVSDREKLDYIAGLLGAEKVKREREFFGRRSQSCPKCIRRSSGRPLTGAFPSFLKRTRSPGN